MKEYAESFYHSQAWHKCRRAYLCSHTLCERCLAHGEIVPAKIVHHKNYITPDNISDADIILNFDNLEALCQECHNVEHHGEQVIHNYLFDVYGQLIPSPPCEKLTIGKMAPVVGVNFTVSYAHGFFGKER